MESLYPLGPIAEGIGLNVTVLSYVDTLHFGLFACRKLLPELDQLAVHIDDALGELVACALDARGATGLGSGLSVGGAAIAQPRTISIERVQRHGDGVLIGP